MVTSLKLEEICTTFKSDILVNKIEKNTGEYPVFGAKGIATNIQSYQQSKPYISIIKWGAGVGRAELRPAYSSIVATMLGVIPNENIDLQWLCYLLQSMHLEQYATNAVVPNLYFKDYCTQKVSVPDYLKQEEISHILRTIQQIIEYRKKQLETLDYLTKARFVEMFGNPVPAWPVVTIGDICTDARTGPFGSALHHDEFVDEGIFVLGIDNAVENKFSYNRMRYITEEKYQQLKRYTVHPGDVIITIMGTIGRSAVIPEDMPLAINTKHLACLSPDLSKASSVFLCSAIQMHPAIQRQLKGNAKGAIMDGLNLGIIKRLRFQLPPLQEQKIFEQFYAQVDKSKVVIQKALTETQTLFDSLMQEYFG